MENFYKKNQNLFVFVSKNKHSGNSKINWQRTINKKIPFIQNGAPIYMDLVQKAKVFDLDDRLLVLYFSAMRYIQTEYSCFMPQSEFYQPLKKNEMNRLMENERGLRELKKIKHKYFDDRFLKLYNIMESFFRWGAKYKRKDADMDEYLIANSFNNVFEDMIDVLISDPKFEKEKKNKDGKIIDHLYKYEPLIFASSDEKQKDDLIWYIGDSKYYDDYRKIEGQSIAKQFTYAKNVMQDFFSPEFFDNNEEHCDGDVHYGVRYRDKVTEGYSVTPNFFIRGFVPEYKDVSQYSSDYFIKQGDESPLIRLAREKDQNNEETEDAMIERMWKIRNRHFINRLFDRDTLLLQTYNVNFLYVLKAYMPNHSALRQDFKDRTRKMFRENFLDLLDKKYVFYAVWPSNSLKENLSANETLSAEECFVKKHFHTLLGKMFKPKEFGCLILALENISEETENESEIRELKNMAKMWHEIEDDCSMVLRISPRRIWNDSQKLPPAEFQNAYYDSTKNGFFVKRDEFEKSAIDKEHSIPSILEGRKLSGAYFNDVDLDRITQNGSTDEYYFLPCKEE